MEQVLGRGSQRNLPTMSARSAIPPLAGGAGEVYLSEDAGLTWQRFAIDPALTVMALMPLSATTALASCSDGKRYVIDINRYSYDRATQFVTPRVSLADSDIQAYIKG